MSEMSDPIEQWIHEWGWIAPPSHPIYKMVDIALNHPEEVSRLMKAAIDGPPGEVFYRNTVWSCLPMEEWPDLVQYALEALAQNRENWAARDVIAEASLQCLSVLHPHLETIFRLGLGAGTYYEAWRESGMQNFDFLRRHIEDPSASKEDRKKAWLAMLETRDETVLRYAISAYDSVDLEFDSPGWLPTDLDACLRRVGFERVDNDHLRQLYCDQVFHIVFPPSYLPGESRPIWQRIHPTWRMEGSATPPLRFGGPGHGACGACGGDLHHLITLDPIPEWLPVTGLSRLLLSLCLSCCGWEEPVLFYQHGQDGEPQSIGYEGPRIQPQFPAGPLVQADVWLVKSDRRWRWQDWGLSSGGENFHRIGGHPCWIQDAQYPQCLHCGQTMGFLVQSDSCMPSETYREWLWGVGGICYGFWCDPCRISAFLWQCT